MTAISKQERNSIKMLPPYSVDMTGALDTSNLKSG